MRPGRLTKTMSMEFLVNADDGSEELRLWADYYEATARALELIRTEGTRTPSAVTQIAAEDAKAAEAMRRIKAIRGIR